LTELEAILDVSILKHKRDSIQEHDSMENTKVTSSALENIEGVMTTEAFFTANPPRQSPTFTSESISTRFSISKFHELCQKCGITPEYEIVDSEAGFKANLTLLKEVYSLESSYPSKKAAKEAVAKLGFAALTGRQVSPQTIPVPPETNENALSLLNELDPVSLLHRQSLIPSYA
jgi:hypothetical protein